MQRGRVIAGKYRIESPLARGGMGSVWTARHVLLDLPVAVKFIVASSTASGRLRFEREAKAAAMLQSPHVVHIYDYGVDAEAPYLVMELLDGEDLSMRLAARGRLTPRETAAIVVQVARALRRAAEAAIVHRDLKPSNVFIAHGDEDEGGELVKVLDFGVAKAPRITLDGDATKSGTIVGSPRYMSPEQARASSAVDHRSDLWSLAVIAYRTLTGRVPFLGDDLTALVFKICNDPPPPPSQIMPELGTAFDAFFARALQRDPDQRFQTARAFASAFTAAAGEDLPPSSTRSPSVSSSPSLPEVALERTRPSLSPPVPDTSAEPPALPVCTDSHPVQLSAVRRRLPSLSLAQAPDELGEASLARRRPWHVRLRQGIAGAGIATVVVGGAMSALLVRQRAVQGATAQAATAPAAPEQRSAVQPPAAPTCVVVHTAMATTPTAPAARGSVAAPAPTLVGAATTTEHRRSRYEPKRP